MHVPFARRLPSGEPSVYQLSVRVTADEREL